MSCRKTSRSLTVKQGIELQYATRHNLEALRLIFSAALLCSFICSHIYFCSMCVALWMTQAAWLGVSLSFVWGGKLRSQGRKCRKSRKLCRLPDHGYKRNSCVIVVFFSERVIRHCILTANESFVTQNLKAFSPPLPSLARELKALLTDSLHCVSSWLYVYALHRTDAFRRRVLSGFDCLGYY